MILIQLHYITDVLAPFRTLALACNVAKQCLLLTRCLLTAIGKFIGGIAREQKTSAEGIVIVYDAHTVYTRSKPKRVHVW